MSIDVTLKIRSTSEDGFTQTSAPDGTHYFYQFSGGNMGDGDVVVRVGPAVDIIVTLVDSPNFGIGGASVSGDNETEIAWNRNSATQITFTDTPSLKEEGIEIFIQAIDNTNEKQFDCDPRVSNED